jgi:CBS domain-containing protein
MDAADIMPRDVLSINPDASISDAAHSCCRIGSVDFRLLRSRQFVLTEGDPLRRAEPGTTRDQDRDVMTPDPELGSCPSIRGLETRGLARDLLD